MDSRTSGQKVLVEPVPAATFVLTHLDLFNWGAFNGRHTAEIDLEGTAIIGSTGSGKTTLVDALMTLIAEHPRYNLASTGGHESDRDLVSYIRGVSGAGNNSGDNEHICRPGKTLTGLAARFGDGDKTLTLAALLWLEDSSSAASDLKRQWIFSQAAEEGLDHWLEIHHSGGGRALKQFGRETPGLYVCNSKQEYLAHLHRFFDVGANAFTLLNRAAGLKQLNSIDEVFRELVLEDTSAFERATEVAQGFDDLAAIHEELEVARQQQQSLQPIAVTWQKHHELQEKLGLQRELKSILPIWYAEWAHQLLHRRLEEIAALIEAHSDQHRELCAQIQETEQRVQTLRDVYLRAGGSSIEQLREQIRLQQQLVADRSLRAEDYKRLTQRLALEPILTAAAFATNQEHARKLQTTQQGLFKQEQEEAWAAGVAQQRQQEALTELTQELEQARARPRSNIPGLFQQFRGELAAHLGLEEELLPFLAELVEVVPSESRWRGAIERALGGHRLRVMVPADSIQTALSWINRRDNRLHVRVLEVARDEAGGHTDVEFFADGFTRKLKLKAHPHEVALRRLLASIDRHCVPSSELLHRTPHGLTEQGLMSNSRGQFEKQDQKRLDQDWMTGFDNKDRMASLSGQIDSAQAMLRDSRAAYEVSKRRAQDTEALLRLVEALLAADFATIDQPGAERALSALQERLEILSEPESDTEKARRQWEEGDGQLKALRAREREVDVAKREQESCRAQWIKERERLYQLIGEGLNEVQRALAAQHLAVSPHDAVEQLPDIERKAERAIVGAIESLGDDLRSCGQLLVRQMANAKRLDTGALAEAGTEIQDVPTYLEQLRQLTEEALPEKLQRFLSYLNQSSDQGVTQLLSDIENEVSLIEERMEDLNHTLQRVDFQPACYLRLNPQRIVHESLRTLQQAQRHMRSAALKDDVGESHFRALRHMVDLLREAADKRKTLGSRALLDPRYRLQFTVEVINRATGAVLEVRGGSQGGSGGEKEIIASYVLTASLSYALCPSGQRRPLFGTIVLDEAFSKSSQAVAGRIISALDEFGLHPLFVTPYKELRLLRAHTRSAILVHRKGQRATLTTLSWEELETRARERAE
jgi:uncharacterized protein YPO0396